MIMREYFEKNMSETLLLLNSTMKKDAIGVIYDRIKDNFINQDLRFALDDILSPDKDVYKFTFPQLMKKLYLHRAIRYERTREEDKRKFEEGSKSFWSAEYDDTCITRQCMTCPKRAGRCDTIAKHTIEAIIMMTKKTHRIKERAETWDDYYKEVRTEQGKYNKMIIDELNRQFPGVGFDMKFQINKTITREEATGYATKPDLKLVKPRADIDDFIPEED